MKRLLIAFFILSSMSYGQFFESKDTENSTSQDFSLSNGSTGDDELPDQGTDNPPGNPGESPADPSSINNWLLLLPLAGIAIGLYARYKKQIKAS